MSRIYGYNSADEMIENITDIPQQIYVDPTDHQEFQRWMNTLGAVKNQVYQSRRKDSSTIWVEENTRAVRDENGNLLYYEGIIEDITEQKRRNEILEKRVRERTQGLFETLKILKATQAELLIDNALLRNAEDTETFDYQVGGSLH